MKFLPVKEEGWADNSPEGMQKQINVFPEMCTKCSSCTAKTPVGMRQNSIGYVFYVMSYGHSEVSHTFWQVDGSGEIGKLAIQRCFV